MPLRFYDLFALIFLLAAFYYLVYPKVVEGKKISSGFFISSLPFIVMVSVLAARAEPPDASLLKYATLIVSGIYLYSASTKIEENLSSYRPEYILGTTIAVSLIYLIGLPDMTLLLKAFSMTYLAMAISAIFFIFSWKEKFSALIIFSGGSHFFDASSTVLALQNSLEEQRFLANFFIDIFGPYGIFLLKAVVIFPILIYSEEKFSENMYRLLAYVVFALGLALGTRNLFLI